MKWTVILLAAALLIPATALVGQADDPAPAEAISDAEIQALVGQLGNDDFKLREKASRRLAQLGERARKALEQAARAEASLEARWRAQQLLRRLGGDQAPKPVDRTEPVPEVAPGNRFGLDQDEIARLRKMMERWSKRFDDRFGRGGLRGGLIPFGESLRGLGMGTVRAPGLELIRTQDGVKLTVIDESGAGAEARKTYTGKTLDEILAAHPELAKHRSMVELEAKSADPMQRLQDLVKKGVRGLRSMPFGGTTTITSGKGLKITQDANGARVEVDLQDKDGNWTKKTYTGESLEAIKKANPELAERLAESGFRFDLHFGRPGIQIFGRGHTGGDLERARPTTPRVAARPLFGIGFEAPDEILAMHLGLAKGEAALVMQVVEHSQAQEIGLERGDIIVRVGTEQIRSGDQLRDLLKRAALAKGPLEIEIIRRGARQVLSR